MGSNTVGPHNTQTLPKRPQVKWGTAYSRMNIRPEKLAYSPYVDVAPPDWQTPDGVVPLVVWSIKDPLVPTDLGGRAACRARQGGVCLLLRCREPAGRCFAATLA